MLWSFSWKDTAVGHEIGLLQQLVDDLFGLVVAVQANRGRGQGLATAEHHCASSQCHQIALEFPELCLSGLDAIAHPLKFRLGALNVGVAGVDLLAQAVALGFQSFPFLLKGSQFFAQGDGSCLGALQLRCDPQGGIPGLLAFLVRGFEVAATVPQSLLQGIEFEQTDPELLADQQQQSER